MVFASNGPSRRYTTTRDSTDDPTGGDVDEAVGGSVGYALAIAISPIPIAALNPKDILLAAAGGAEIASTNLSDGSTVVALVVFTAIAASTATLPVGATVGQRGLSGAFTPELSSTVTARNALFEGCIAPAAPPARNSWSPQS